MAFTMILFCGCTKHDSVESTLESTGITIESNSVEDIANTETTTTTNTSSNTEATVTAIRISPILTSITKTAETTVTNLSEFKTTYNTMVTIITTNVVEQPVNTSTPDSAKDLIKNGLFYCYYTIKKNDSWESLYTNYWVTRAQICAFNGLNPNEYLQEGWVIYIPLDTYVPPATWDFDYEPVFDENFAQNGEADDGLVWCNSVTIYTTNSEWGSWYNIKLSASMLDGFKLGPGESFSWFEDVGACQYDDGFVDGGAFVEGGSAPGGGICFTSTGLMQAARGAGCVITERYDHNEHVSYADPGDEASVSWGYQDLKFYNPSKTTGLQFEVTADKDSQSITVTVRPHYPY